MSDTSEIDKLAADLTGAADGVGPFAQKAAAGTAYRVKQGWNERLYSDGHAARTAGSITYDVTPTKTRIDAEIGAKRGEGRQAGIVRLLENGSVHNAPHGYGAAALHENTEDFVRGMAAAADDALKAHQL